MSKHTERESEWMVMSQCGWCQTVINRVMVPENRNGCIRLTRTHTCTPSANAEKTYSKHGVYCLLILFQQCECLFADVMQKDAPHKHTYEPGYHLASFSHTLLQHHCPRSNHFFCHYLDRLAQLMKETAI